MKYRACCAAVAAAIGSVAQADIVTGPLSGGLMDFNYISYQIPALGIAFIAEGYTHGGADWFSLGAVGFDYLVRSPGYLAQAFEEGDGLMAYSGSASPGSGVPIGSVWYDDFSQPVYETIGQVGGPVYIGFRIGTYLADEDRFAYNYGFFQFQKEGGLDYRMVAWAYETAADTDLIVFNIPAPSGAALIALGGLVAARRRR